jgi:tetratricopeptide (TPR) repeat protein
MLFSDIEGSTALLNRLLDEQGEPDAARPLFECSLAIWRDLGDRDHEAGELNSLGITHHHLGHLDTARVLLEQSAAVAREIDNPSRLAAALTNLGQTEADAGNLERAEQVLQEALSVDRKLGDTLGVALDQQSLVIVRLRAGQLRQASEMLSATFGYVVSSGNIETLASSIELSAAIAAEVGHGTRAARLAGAAEALRRQAGIPMPQPEAAMLERYLAPARAAFARDAWDAELAAGAELSQQEALALLLSPTPVTAPRPGPAGRDPV